MTRRFLNFNATLAAMALMMAGASGQPLLAEDGMPEAAPPVLTLEQQTGLRCSAAFALVAYGQSRGDAAALAWPAVADRGREFFVRFSAQLMDETGMSRDQVAALLGQEAQDLSATDRLGAVMPACLLLLDSADL